MTIKAVLRDGRIQPIEPLPSDWTDGQELVVEEPESDDRNARLDEWVSNLDKATALIPADEHDRFLLALDEIHHDLKRRGRVLSQVDMVLAALARQMNLTLVTTDRDFEALPDVKTANWLGGTGNNG